MTVHDPDHRFGVVGGFSPGENLERCVKTVQAYLPNNYVVVGSDGNDDDGRLILIAGKDHAGWTMQDYVIPRLNSGMYACAELVERVVLTQ